MGFRRFFKKDGTEAVVNKLKYYFLSKSGELTEYADKATAEAAVSDPEDRIKLSGSKGDFRRADDLDENITVLTRIKANVDMSNVNLTNALAAEGYSGGADKVPYVSWNHAAGSLGSFTEGSSIGSIDCGGQSGIDGSAITGASVTAGSLPSGVTLASNGALSGTMPEQTASSTFTFTVSLTTGSHTSTREFTITNTADNDAPVWSTSAGALTAAGVSAYTKTLSATDPEGETLSYTVQSGTLPSWASLSTSGVISGTPDSWGSPSSFTVRVTDVTGSYADRSFTLTAVNSVPTWSTASGSLSNATDSPYNTSVSSSDPEGGSISYTVASGTLPSGLALSTSGTISGTPSDLNGTTYSFDIRATDPQGGTADRSFTILAYNNPPSWTTSSGSLGTAPLGANFSATVAASDPESTAVTYSVSSGSLNPGLSINSSTGVISGTASTADDAVVTFTLRATDAHSQTADRSFSIQNPPEIVSWSTSSTSSFPGSTHIETGGQGVRYKTPGSYTWTAPFSGDIKVWVIGGAGSGQHGNSHGGGGGGGGAIIEALSVTTGQSYSLVVGEGGQQWGSSHQVGLTSSFGGGMLYGYGGLYGGDGGGAAGGGWGGSSATIGSNGGAGSHGGTSGSQSPTAADGQQYGGSGGHGCGNGYCCGCGGQTTKSGNYGQVAGHSWPEWNGNDGTLDAIANGIVVIQWGTNVNTTWNSSTI